MSTPRVVTVIVGSQRPQDIEACLRTLAASSYSNHAAVVVDYPSAAVPGEALRAVWPDIAIIASPTNGGYAGNNNVGVRWALQHGADWVFILNDDTVLAADCLERLVAAAQSDPRIGIAGPLVYHYDEPDVIQSAGGVLGPHWRALRAGRDEPDKGQYCEMRPVEWISGCGMLARRQMVEQIGVFDDRYFAYWEEIDWCVRARRAGWQLLHVPRARLWHKGVRRDYSPTPAVTYYTTRNHFLLLAKNRAPLLAWLALVTNTVRTVSSWTFRPKWRDMRPHRNAMIRGVRDFALRRWGMRPS